MSHEHAPVPRSGSRHLGSLQLALGLVVSFMVIEFVAGRWTRSLALVSDAGHMATDALGLGMAVAAIVVANRAAGASGRTYGLYRLEILAALANAVLLFGVAGYVIWEAIRRFAQPPDLLAGPMLVVAVTGLAVNVVCWRLLRIGAGESLNIRGAYTEVLMDMLGSIGVIAAALIVITTGWPYADPLFAVVIGLLIIPRAWDLGRRAVHVLVQAAPVGLDVAAIHDELAAIDGVVDVHDLHVWTLTSDMDVATVHLTVADGHDQHAVLDAASELLRDEHGLAHATLQVEPESHHACSEVVW